MTIPGPFFTYEGYRFCLPQEENSLAAHLCLVEAHAPLRFRPSSSSGRDFDSLIARRTTLPSAGAEGLHTNLALLRNILLAQWFPAGSSARTEPGRARALSEMAAVLGRGLTLGLHGAAPLHRLNPLFWPYLAAPRLTETALNVRGSGAALMYRFLLHEQQRFSLLNPATWVGKPNRDWALPAFHLTVFATSGRRPLAGAAGTASFVKPSEPPIWEQLLTDAEQIESRHRDSRAVSELEQPVLEESVRLAREILEKLKIRLGAQSPMEWLDCAPDRLLAEANALAQIATIYADSVQQALRAAPSLGRNPILLRADEAFGELSSLLSLAAQKTKPDDADAPPGASLAKSADSHDKNTLRMSDLLERIEAGLKAIAEALRAAAQQGNNLYQLTRDQQRVQPAGNIPLPPYADRQKQVQKAFMELHLDDRVLEKAEQQRSNQRTRAAAQHSHSHHTGEHQSESHSALRPARSSSQPEERQGHDGQDATRQQQDAALAAERQRQAAQKAAQKAQKKQPKTGKGSLGKIAHPGAKATAHTQPPTHEDSEKPEKSPPRKMEGLGLSREALAASQEALKIVGSGTKLSPGDNVKPSTLPDEILAAQQIRNEPKR